MKECTKMAANEIETIVIARLDIFDDESQKLIRQNELIRCRDCRHNRGDNKCLHPNSIIKIPADDDYCSYAERKEQAK